MKKKLFILGVVSLMVCLIGFATIAYACDHNKHKECKSRLERGQICLLQKEPPPDLTFPGPCGSYLNDQDNQAWPAPVDPTRDAWGKLNFSPSGRTFEFNFQGHGLTPGNSYTLIYYPDDAYYGFCYPGYGLIYLGSDIADRSGHVHIAGSLDTGDLPAVTDHNNIANNGSYNGAKIWLVLTEDILLTPTPTFQNWWTPKEYLFEKDLITYDAQ
jgi:hypothetical protein